MTDRKPLRVLLVEDNAMDRRHVARLLAHSKRFIAEVHEVESLNAAAMVLRNEAPFDVALVDLTLPDGNPAITVDLFLRAAPDVPLIVLSGSEDREVADACTDRGAMRFILKSADMEPAFLSREIRGAIANATSLRRAVEHAREIAVGLASTPVDDRPGPRAALYLGYLDAIESVVMDTRAMLASSWPSAAEQYQHLLDASGYYAAIREARIEARRGEGRPSIPPPSRVSEPDDVARDLKDRRHELERTNAGLEARIETLRSEEAELRARIGSTCDVTGVHDIPRDLATHARGVPTLSEHARAESTRWKGRAAAVAALVLAVLGGLGALVVQIIDALKD